jgi:hypothetical protein
MVGDIENGSTELVKNTWYCLFNQDTSDDHPLISTVKFELDRDSTHVVKFKGSNGQIPYAYLGVSVNFISPIQTEATCIPNRFITSSSQLGKLSGWAYLPLDAIRSHSSSTRPFCRETLAVFLKLHRFKRFRTPLSVSMKLYPTRYQKHNVSCIFRKLRI